MRDIEQLTAIYNISRGGNDSIIRRKLIENNVHHFRQKLIILEPIDY